MLSELLPLPLYYTLLIGIFIIVALIISRVLKKALSKILGKDIGERLHITIRKPIIASIILVGIFLIITRLPIPKLYLSYTITAFYVIWTILIGYVVMKIIDQTVETFHIKLKIPRASVIAIRKIIKWLSLLIIIFVILHVLNILKNIIAITMLVIGTLIFLAFAGWSIMGNITAGLVIMIWKPFQIGDRIEIIPENITGTVQDITLMFTKIKTDNGEIYIPNTLVIQKIIKTLR